MLNEGERQQEMGLISMDLGQRVPSEHPLRKVLELVDFSFVREEVRHRYSRYGRSGTDPVVVMKLFFLLYWGNHSSTRDLFRHLSYRLDYLFFLGLSLDSVVPDHSIMSKCKRRWGSDVFESLFTQILVKCAQGGLIDGKTLFIDSSLINANASNDSTLSVDSAELMEQLREVTEREMNKLGSEPLKSAHCADTADEDVSSEGLDETTDSCEGLEQADVDSYAGPKEVDAEPSQAGEQLSAQGLKKGKHLERINLTDPQSTLMGRKNGKYRHSVHRYKNHRLIDSRYGVIVAQQSTHASVGDEVMLPALIQQSGEELGLSPFALAADSQYGTHSNYLFCEAENILPYFKPNTPPTPKETDRFTLEDFIYVPEQNVYLCPHSKELKPYKTEFKSRRQVYVSKKSDCSDCPLRQKCLSPKAERRELREPSVLTPTILNSQRIASSQAAKASRARRMQLQEGQFGQAARAHHYKRSRYRGLKSQRIQDCIIASIQNLKILIKGSHPKTAGTGAQIDFKCLKINIIRLLGGSLSPL